MHSYSIQVMVAPADIFISQTGMIGLPATLIGLGHAAIMMRMLRPIDAASYSHAVLSTAVLIRANAVHA